MQSDPSRQSTEPDELARAIVAAAQKAVRQAVLFHKRIGNPICVWRDGQVVWIPPEEIVVPEDEDTMDGNG